jgi:hypothetical protein
MGVQANSAHLLLLKFVLPLAMIIAAPREVKFAKLTA